MQEVKEEEPMQSQPKQQIIEPSSEFNMPQRRIQPNPDVIATCYRLQDHEPLSRNFISIDCSVGYAMYARSNLENYIKNNLNKSIISSQIL